MRSGAHSARAGAKAPPATQTASTPKAAPAEPAPVFTLHELLAVQHALSGAMPDSMYAPWVSAARKVDALVAVAKAERSGMEHVSAPIARVLSKLKPGGSR